jgi:hypothetical protein
MTASRSIPRSEWRAFFDRIASAELGRHVEVETSSLDLGDQIVAEWLPLIGITYDSHDDVLDVAFTGLEFDHLINHPTDIQILEGPHGLETICVVTEQGEQHLIKLKDPLMLPPAVASVTQPRQ